MPNRKLSLTVLFKFLVLDATKTQASYFVKLLKANDKRDTNDVDASL